VSESDDKKFTNKDIYQQLWEGRNFELTHFWQRSVFLTSIFVVLLAGYGKVIFAMYFPESGKLSLSYRQHFIAWGITFLCLVFSMLWIMMSKGSKLWYERYEESLNALFEQSDLLQNSKFGLPRHGKLRYPPDNRYSDSLFSVYAGGYSVSKVNIAIGIISMFVFSVLNALHFAKFLYKSEIITLKPIDCALFGIIEIIIVFTISYLFLKYLCKSGESK
jgi:hypothetical protein